MKKMFALLLGVTPSLAFAQLAHEADPQHYKLVFENECVRAVHFHLDAHETNAVAYESKGGAVIALTEFSVERVAQDGDKASATKHAGDSWYTKPVMIKSLANKGDMPAEWILVTPKGKAGCEK